MKVTDVLPLVEPAEVGLSPSRLATIRTALSREIAAGRMPGAVIAIARAGKLAHLEAFGHRDPATGAPMTTDTLFWIASMTKPVTTVGALTLHEEGRLSLDEPIGTGLPELGDRQVAEVASDGTLRYVPAQRQPTVQDLLRHTSGIVEGLLGTTPVHELYAEAVGDGMTTFTGQEFINRLSRVPLLHQPGTVWHYGWGLDLVGLLIERVVGAPLGAHLRKRVLEPLNMHDTTFGLPAGHEERFARPLPLDPIGRPQHLPDLGLSRFNSGGAGLVSSAPDYLRFAQMLLDGGQLGDTRVLGRKTVEYMTADQLPPGTDTHRLETISARLTGYGFGLGLAIRRSTGVAPTAGTPGDMTWPGAAGTYWWVDPREELAVVFMTHTPALEARVRYYQLIRALVLQALVD